MTACVRRIIAILITSKKITFITVVRTLIDWTMDSNKQWRFYPMYGVNHTHAPIAHEQSSPLHSRDCSIRFRMQCTNHSWTMCACASGCHWISSTSDRNWSDELWWATPRHLLVRTNGAWLLRVGRILLSPLWRTLKSFNSKLFKLIINSFGMGCDGNVTNRDERWTVCVNCRVSSATALDAKARGIRRTRTIENI